MDTLGEFWWVPVVFAGVGAFFAGYMRRTNGNGGRGSSTIHGAVMIDSTLGERMAAALEALVEIERGRDAIEQRRRDDEHADAVRERDALRRKLDAQERGKG